MYQCITVRGYLGLFDIAESSAEYRMNKNLALSLIEKNKNRSIPLVISHIDYKVDLTVGYITGLEIDNKGLYCKAVIDNCAFIKIQTLINEVFITYFTEANPSPFLFLKSCFPSFSLSHNKKTLLIKHVALVSLGARRGTLIDYEGNNTRQAKCYTNTTDDIYALLVCYTRDSLKCADERNELLFKDALICNTIDTDFITAGRNCTKKSIKTNINGSSIDKHSNMSDISNEVLGYLGKIASVLSEGKGVKRSSENIEQPCSKRPRQEPILNASQTLSNGISDQEQKNSLRNEMNELKNEMKELFMMQSNTFKDLMKQQMDTSAFLTNAPNYMYNVPPEYAYKFGYNRPFNFTYGFPANATQQSFQSANQEPISSNGSCERNVQSTSTPPVSSSSQQNSNITCSSEESEPIQNLSIPNTEMSLTEQQEENQQESTSNDSSEELLIQAGAKVNSSEHLINELFKHFVQNTFRVKTV